MRSPSSNPGPRRGRELSELGIVENAALCVGGKIVSVGTTKDALRDSWVKKSRKRIVEIDCAGQVVLPGFVDSHTHPAFVSPRLIDFEKRVSGATYEQIAEAGGGIRSSVEGVRKAPKGLLAESPTLHDMAEQGTTTVEAKSGYGLSVDSELKSLQAIRDAATRWPGTVISTLLGAHVVPNEFQGRSQNYVEIVCLEMIPLAAKHKLAQFVDVFCDRGAFTAQDRKVFRAAKTQTRGSSPRRAIHESRLGAVLAIQACIPGSHGSRFSDADISASRTTTDGGDVGAGGELLSRPSEVSTCAAVDRRGSP